MIGLQRPLHTPWGSRRPSETPREAQANPPRPQRCPPPPRTPHKQPLIPKAMNPRAPHDFPCPLKGNEFHDRRSPMMRLYVYIRHRSHPHRDSDNGAGK